MAPSDLYDTPVKSQQYNFFLSYITRHIYVGLSSFYPPSHSKVLMDGGYIYNPTYTIRITEEDKE